MQATSEFIEVDEITSGYVKDGEYKAKTIRAMVNVDRINKAIFYPDGDNSVLYMTNGKEIVIKGNILRYFVAPE